jgi:hypothetical protein
MAFNPIYGIKDRHGRSTLLPYKQGIDDGSTLSLDFTTGVLDPRLTFTRSTNATFINSQGLVEYADANMVVNSTMLVVTGYTQTLTGSGAVTINGDNTVQFNGTSGRATWFQTISVSQGLPISYSVEVTSFTNNNLRTTDLFAVTPAHITGAQYRYTDTNGVTSTIGAFDSLPVAGSDGRGLYTVYGTTAGTSFTVLMGADCNGVGRLGDVTMARPQVRYDQIVPRRSYLPNSNTSLGNFNTPRFDYDPNTRQPLGLLMEAGANNLTALSESFAISGGSNNWNPSGLNGSAVTATTQTNPAGLASSIRLVEDTANSAHTVFTAVPVTSGSQYTFSVFVRGDGTRTLAGLRITLSGAATDYSVIFDLADGTTGTAYTAGTPGTVTPRAVQYPGGWWRISVTMNAPAASTLFYIYNATTKNATAGLQGFTGTSNGIYVWGAQVELGSGASSYIPTGASTGSRALDHCYATGANFTSWFSTGAGTVVAVSDNTKNNTQNLTANISDGTTNNYVRMGFKVGGASNEYLLTTVGGPAAFQGAADSGYAPALNTVYKMAYAWDTNNFAIVANGGAVATDTSGTLAGAGVLTQLVIGGDFVASPLDIYFKNGHIRSLKYYPTRLANAQLQALTT